MKSIEERHPELGLGGSWRPKTCTPSYNIAILVPYRDRELHLRAFLRHMHPFLQKQYLSYTIFVVEQVMAAPWNMSILTSIYIRVPATNRQIQMQINVYNHLNREVITLSPVSKTFVDLSSMWFNPVALMYAHLVFVSLQNLHVDLL